MGVKVSCVVVIVSGIISGLASWALIYDRLDGTKYVVAGYGCAVVYGLIFIMVLWHLGKLAEKRHKVSGDKV